MSDKKKPWRDTEADEINALTGSTAPQKKDTRSTIPPEVEKKPIENIAGYSAEYLDNVAGVLLSGDSTVLTNRNAAFINSVTVRALFSLNRRLKKLEADLGN